MEVHNEWYSIVRMMEKADVSKIFSDKNLTINVPSLISSSDEADEHLAMRYDSSFTNIPLNKERQAFDTADGNR